MCVLHGVCQQLAEHVVPRHLHLLRETLVELQTEVDRRGRPGHDTLGRHGQSVIAQGRRMQALGQISQLIKRPSEFRTSRSKQPGLVAAVVEVTLGLGQDKRDRQEPLLGTVMEVALKAAPVKVAGGSDPATSERLPPEACELENEQRHGEGEPKPDPSDNTGTSGKTGERPLSVSHGNFPPPTVNVEGEPAPGIGPESSLRVGVEQYGTFLGGGVVLIREPPTVDEADPDTRVLPLDAREHVRGSVHHHHEPTALVGQLGHRPQRRLNVVDRSEHDQARRGPRFLHQAYGTRGHWPLPSACRRDRGTPALLGRKVKAYRSLVPSDGLHELNDPRVPRLTDWVDSEGRIPERAPLLFRGHRPLVGGQVASRNTPRKLKRLRSGVILEQPPPGDERVKLAGRERWVDPGQASQGGKKRCVYRDILVHRVVESNGIDVKATIC